MLARYANLPETVKAITVRQPYASAIIRGFKSIENRSWRTRYRGPLLIHAAAGPEISAGGLVSRVELESVGDLLGGKPRGVLLGIVTLVDVRRASGCDDPWAIGPWCWVLKDAMEFANPVKWKGKLSLFEVGREVFGSTLDSSTYPWRAKPSTRTNSCELLPFAVNVLT